MEENIETSDFKPKSDWSVQEASSFANTLANHGWTREANADVASSCIYSLCRQLKERDNGVSHSNGAKIREALKSCVDEMCDRCRELAAARGNPLPCLNGCEPVRKAKFALIASRATAENSSVVGDRAKMREALQQAKVAILAARKKMGVDNPIILEIIDAALAAPPRNCDVGTVKDQEDRLEKFCDAHKYVGDDGANVCSRDCPCYNGMNCGIGWAQMPYEDGETGGGSHGSRNGERKAQLAGVAREAVRR